MSTELYDDGELTVTRFWGGDERGQCVQVTQPTPNDEPTMNGEYFRYVKLTKAQANALVSVLAGWLDGNTNVTKPTHAPDCALAVNARHGCTCGQEQE